MVSLFFSGIYSAAMYAGYESYQLDSGGTGGVIGVFICLIAAFPLLMFSMCFIFSIAFKDGGGAVFDDNKDGPMHFVLGSFSANLLLLIAALIWGGGCDMTWVWVSFGASILGFICYAKGIRESSL